MMNQPGCAWAPDNSELILLLESSQQQHQQQYQLTVARGPCAGWRLVAQLLASAPGNCFLCKYQLVDS
jgi:hypothetical protein